MTLQASCVSHLINLQTSLELRKKDSCETHIDTDVSYSLFGDDDKTKLFTEASKSAQTVQCIGNSGIRVSSNQPLQTVDGSRDIGDGFTGPILYYDTGCDPSAVKSVSIPSSRPLSYVAFLLLKPSACNIPTQLSNIQTLDPQPSALFYYDSSNSFPQSINSTYTIVNLPNDIGQSLTTSLQSGDSVTVQIQPVPDNGPSPFWRNILILVVALLVISCIASVGMHFHMSMLRERYGTDNVDVMYLTPHEGATTEAEQKKVIDPQYLNMLPTRKYSKAAAAAAKKAKSKRGSRFRFKKPEKLKPILPISTTDIAPSADSPASPRPPLPRIPTSTSVADPDPPTPISPRLVATFPRLPDEVKEGSANVSVISTRSIQYPRLPEEVKEGSANVSIISTTSRRSVQFPRLPEEVKEGSANVSICSVASVRTVEGSGVSSETCAVCLCEYEDGEMLRELGCGHAFHCECIDQWLTKQSSECPLCKIDATPPGAVSMPVRQSTGATAAGGEDRWRNLGRGGVSAAIMPPMIA
ncbi:E3 ubiquitin-protein ligase rnf13 [Rhizophlyctis rosea]|nr:E3 ubiquitin-protein ligase rnf13 [Rhizophlyctis rosea]